MTIAGAVLVVGLVVLIGFSGAYAEHETIPVVPSLFIMGSVLAIVVALCILVVDGVRLLRMRGGSGESEQAEPIARPVPETIGEPAVEPLVIPPMTRPSFRARSEDEFEVVSTVLTYLAIPVIGILLLGGKWLWALAVFGGLLLLVALFSGTEGIVRGTLRIWHHARWHPRPTPPATHDDAPDRGPGRSRKGLPGARGRRPGVGGALGVGFAVRGP